METTAAELKSEILEALAHPNRIRILESLRQGPRCNCEIAPELDLEQSNLSRHLKILLQAGLLLSWKDGLRVNFKVADERIFKILDIAATVARRDVARRAEALQEA
jgi:DNA-binding transcriptional ArsR family regulator